MAAKVGVRAIAPNIWLGLRGDQGDGAVERASLQMDYAQMVATTDRHAPLQGVDVSGRGRFWDYQAGMSWLDLVGTLPQIITTNSRHSKPARTRRFPQMQGTQRSLERSGHGLDHSVGGSHATQTS